MSELNVNEIAPQSGATVTVTGLSAASATLTSPTVTSPTITGGSVTGITDLAVADGGTGASTAAGALTNLGVSAAAQTILDDATVGDIRTTLGVPSTTEAILDTLIDAKGDIVVGTAADTPAVLTVGTNGDFLVAQSGETAGLRWDTISDFTEDTTPDKNADYVLTYDASASAHKKVLVGNMNGPVLGTPVTASTTAVDFTGIPSWVKKITVHAAGLSTNGTDGYLLQIGDSGGFEATGYTSASIAFATSAVGTHTQSTVGFLISTSATAASVHEIQIHLALLDSSTNTWSFSSQMGNNSNNWIGVGTKSLSGVLTGIRLTTTNATNTFDAGKVNILYE